jgi:hypothetical protein
MQAILESLRRAGWNVIGHYDEVVKGRFSTHWKLRRDNKIVTGEGPTDAEALSSIRARVGLDPDVRLSDAGPWTAGRETTPRRSARGLRTYLQSEDFTHDVRLYVSGDFATAEDEMAYAVGLAERMNAMPMPDPVACPGKDPERP